MSTFYRAARLPLLLADVTYKPGDVVNTAAVLRLKPRVLRSLLEVGKLQLVVDDTVTAPGAAAAQVNIHVAPASKPANRKGQL